MKTIIVGGALAGRPENGGGAWVRLAWVRGLRRLGFDVWLIDTMNHEHGGSAVELRDSPGARWFSRVVHAFGMEDRASLLHERFGSIFGPSRSTVARLMHGAEALVNLGGHIRDPDLIGTARRAAYVDLDPGYTQIWHEQGVDLGLDRHTDHFTVALNLGQAGCSIPDVGFRWKPLLQPVVLDDWPASPPRGRAELTTVGSWRGPFGPLEHGGRRYGVKLHEFRKLISLPERSAIPLRAALRIHPADDADRNRLVAHGWRLDDPLVCARDPDRFRAFVQASAGELSAAQGVYVDTRSGWFSDRSARYLASGKPVILQDTGYGSTLPVGEGLLPFVTAEDALARIAQVRADYRRHARGARAIAREWFDSDRVIPRFLSDLGLSVGAAPASTSPREAVV